MKKSEGSMGSACAEETEWMGRWFTYLSQPQLALRRTKAMPTVSNAERGVSE